MRSNLSAIPTDLRTWNHWVVWRYLERNGKETKPPFSPRTGNPARVNDPRAWGTFEEAVRALERGQYVGVSYILMRWDPFCGIDLDHVVEDGRIVPWAQAIVDHFHSYTEWSPSHSGLHIWVRGTIPGDRRRNERVEMYDDRRSLTVTGAHVDGTPHTIEGRQPELEQFYWHHFPSEEPRQPLPSAPPQLPTNMSDADLLERAKRAKNGFRFARLWDGDTQDYDGDHSRADLALCAILAYWCGNDASRVDRLFRLSGLYKGREEKWDRRHFASGETYGEMTIAKAISSQSNAQVSHRVSVCRR